ncbi:TonB-dependent receptor domain-containing protein [Ekhidna sp.]|uniref:TonB-dependent receptor domain-containing protein n=1 Tax=Ekhidna sp. TaxID=2608089 RepID=UPI003B58F67F
MIRNLTKMIFGLVLTVCTVSAYAQTTVSGTIVDSEGEPLIGVNVLVQGTVLGTITDIDGKFTLTVQSQPPFNLVISYVGYETQRIEVSASTTQIDIQLEESTLLGQEVVVSASRVEESSLKSPVSIERMDILDIQSAPSPDFYSGIKNLNGVDFSTQSLTFKSVNARGFGSNGNTRFVQLIDGIDNQAPGLNFPVGNVVGISELDLESVELIPGAASALYGPNAIQGILLMKSKSPFDYQGLDFYSKVGVTHIDEEDHEMSPYTDIGLRYAKAIDNKWAFKINASWLRAQDFIGVDYRDQSGATVEGNLASNRENNRTYDGINVYGDFLIDVGTIADLTINNPNTDPGTAASLSGIRSLLPNGANGAFSPTGYRESDYVDNTTESLKLGGALHYRLNDKIEAIGQVNWGQGSSVYTANDRFILDNFSIWTGKLELRGDNFFVRGYTTQENSGDTYAANTVASLINQRRYLPAYFGAYVDFLTGGNTTGANPGGTQYAPNNYTALHGAARAVADAAQPGANSETFQSDFDEFRGRSIAEGGAKFLDKSALWHYEGSYNFKNEIDFADVVVGANFRTYALNSEGTLFTLDESGDEVSFNEFGGYVQISKNVIDNVKLQGSVRFDKNENFDGQFSPRLSGVWEFLADQNLRASFQRGFRIPTTQDQYIDLDVVTRRLIGRNDILTEKYNIEDNTVYTTQSVMAAQASGDVNDLVVAADAYKPFETEKVTTWEVGYKGLLLDGKLLIDAFYFNSTYQDFGAEIDITQAVVTGDIQSVPSGYDVGSAGARHDDAELQAFVDGGATGVSLQRYGYDTNIDEDINTYGYGFGAEYTFLQGFNFGANASYNKLEDLDDLTARTYNVAFNTPEWRYNITFGNRKVTERIGFGLTYRWQDAFLWQSAIGSSVIPDFATLDAQVTYRLPSINGRIKIGGSNILNERYTTSHANPRMGALYYVQLNLDNILSNF